MSTELAALTETEFRDYGVRKNIIRTELEMIGQSSERIGKELAFIREHDLYRQEYDTFAEFVQTEYGKSATWAYQQLEHIRVLTNIESVEPVLHSKPGLKQTHVLATLPDDEQADAYAEATEKAAAAGKAKPTTKDVEKVVKQRKAANGGEYKPPPNTGPSGEAMLVAGRAWLNSHVTPWINYYDQADECEDAVEQIKQALLFLGTQVEGTEK